MASTETKFSMDATCLPKPNIFQVVLHYYRYLITIIVFCYKKIAKKPLFAPKSTLSKIFDFTIFSKYTEPLYLAYPHVVYMLNNSAITKKIFKYHRSDPTSIFEGNYSMIAMRDLIQYMYQDVEIGMNDSVLTCDKAHTKIYHKFLQKYLSKQAISSRSLLIESNVRKYFDDLDQRENDIARIVNNYVCDNFTGMIFGKNYTSMDDKRLSFSECCAEINKFAFNLVMDKDKKYASDDIKYKKILPTLDVLKPIIDTIIDENREIFANENFTLAQNRALVFTLLFAGQETTNALIMYIIYKLSKIGTEIRNSVEAGLMDLDEAVDHVFNVSLSECTPVYGIGRILRTDIIIRDENNKILQKMRKGSSVTMVQDFLIKNTNTDVSKDYRDYFPFGTGVHRCPGENLVLMEVKMLIKYLLSNYNITLDVNKVDFDYWATKKISGKFSARFDKFGA